jgi:hypothetical protein
MQCVNCRRNLISQARDKEKDSNGDYTKTSTEHPSSNNNDGYNNNEDNNNNLAQILKPNGNTKGGRTKVKRDTTDHEGQPSTSKTDSTTEG